MRRSLFMLFLLLAFFNTAFAQHTEASPDTIPIRSEEAWRFMLDLSADILPHIYLESEQGLSCKLDAKSTKATLESLALERGTHPSQLAESVAAYFWNDWTALDIKGYDISTMIQADSKGESLAPLLEAFYDQHSACLLPVMKVLVDGYEGYYQQQADGRYLRLNRKRGEPYQVLALSTDYFEGTGIMEPLGLVYGVRLAGLLQIDWLRKPAIDAMSLSISKRVEASGNPLKLYD